MTRTDLVPTTQFTALSVQVAQKQDKGAPLAQSPGKNLFDSTATYGAGTFWNGATNGVPISIAGWYASAKIPVTVGQTYTINNTRNYQYFDATGNYATFYYNNPTEAPVTFTIPAGVAFVGYNVSTAKLALSQMEVGSTVTSYEPYGVTVPRLLANGDYVASQLTANAATASAAVAKAGSGITVFRSGNQMMVRSQFDSTRDILQPINLANPPVANAGPMVQLYSTGIYVSLVPSTASDATVFPTVTASGLVPIHDASDDQAPLFATWSYVGGDHGWNAGSQVVMTAHGKVAADLGSQWSDGTRTYTLLRIVDANTLLFGNQYTVSAGNVTASSIVPAASLTHVSGATNTATVTITGGTSLVQIHPCTFGSVVKVTLDGKQVANGTFGGTLLVINESYNIVSYKALIDGARANIGVDVFSLISTLGRLSRVSNTYRFTRSQVVVSQTARMYEVSTVNMHVTQAYPLIIPSGGSIKELLAGAGVAGGFDFSTLSNLSTQTSLITVAPSSYLNPVIPVQRMIQWAYDGSNVPQYGLSIGLLPTMDGHPSRRLANTPNGSWWVSSIHKNYPYLIANKVLQIGQSISGTGFRSYLAPPTDTTVVQTVSDGAETWVMVDQVGTTSDTPLALPGLAGKQLTPVAVNNLTTSSDRVTGEGVNVTVATSPGTGLWRAEDYSGRVQALPGGSKTVGDYFIVQQGLVTTLSLAGAYQTLYLWPMYLPDATPVDRACLEVTTLGTGTLRHGVYLNDPATGQPVLVAPLADFGTVDPSSTGVKESTLATPVVLPAGWHWYGVVWQTTNTTGPSIRALGVASGVGPLDIGSTSAAMSGSQMGYSMSAVSGQLGVLSGLASHQLAPARMAYRRS